MINTRSWPERHCWNCFRSTLHRRIWILPKHAAADAMQKQWLLLFQYVFRELHLSQILSAKRIRSIFENCIEHGQIDESMRYTAYDIAMKTFELELSLKPWLEKEGVCKETIRKFSEAVGKAAYVNFEKLADGKRAIPYQRHLSYLRPWKTEQDAGRRTAPARKYQSRGCWIEIYEGYFYAEKRQRFLYACRTRGRSYG